MQQGSTSACEAERQAGESKGPFACTNFIHKVDGQPESSGGH